MAKKSQQLVSIEDFSVKNLSEFQGKKEEQQLLVKDNPFVEIVDKDTFTLAKKHRTALVTGRTTLDKEKRAVAKKIKSIISDPVAEAYDDLIAITTPHENKQQEEVRRYEAILEEERLEKQRKEQERIDAILSKIESITNSIDAEINNLNYEQSLTYEINPTYDNKQVKIEDFEEYGSKFISEIESLKFKLEQRKSFLTAEENNRIEALRLQNERKEQERVQNINKSIFDFQNYWQSKVINLNEQDIENTVNEFNSVESIDCQEFQQDFIDVKEQIELSLNNRIAQIQQQITLENQRIETLTLKRRGILATKGFDFNTLIFVKDSFSYKFDEENLILSDSDFQNKIVEFESKLFKFENPEPAKSEATEELASKQKTKPVGQKSQIELNPKQLKTANFLFQFVQFQSERQSATNEEIIKEFVLKNIK